MPWDVIATDFGGEETINFGPRQESGSALYQIETLATISSRDKDQYIPCTAVTVLCDLACIAVQEHVFIFKDCQQTASVGFGGLIDCIEWSPDGSMLIVGDNLGKLSLLDTDTAEILFSLKIVPEGYLGKAFKRILFNTKTDGITDLIVLAANGQMLVLQGVTPDLFSADEGKIVASLKEKLIQTRADHFHTEGVNDVVCCNNKIVTLGGGDIALGVWLIEHGQLVLEDEVPSLVLYGSGLVEGRVSTDGKYLFVLTDNNVMMLFNTTTMTVINIWSDVKVEQFQLLETKDIQNQSLQDMKLVLLTTGEGNNTNLLVQSLPTGETVYNLQLHQPSTLANCQTSQETLFLAECSPSTEDKQCFSVRLRCLTETNPETRLYRILHKNKFEEAESFAKLYRLDTELVHKVKAHYLLDQLSPWSNNNEERVKEMTKQFTNCLGFIKDDLHVADICMRAALSSLDATQKLLDYSKERLLKVSADKSTDVTQKDRQQALLTKLYEIQHRLVTFRMIHGRENYSAEKWDVFMKTDLMKAVMSMLQQRQLDKGLIILSRHESELEKSLTPAVIKNFLHFIPDHVTAGEIQSVLAETILPTVARLLPQVLDSVVKWIIQKAKSLELLDKMSWPMNALQFLRSIYGVLVKVVDIKYSNSIYTAEDITMKTQIDRVDVLESMRTLITNLQHLYDLQTKYNCKLTFGNFLQETTETVTFRMLDKVVAIEMINQTIEKQIRPYMREHNLREDIIFSKYIKDLLERSGRMSSYLGEAVWEPKVIAIINCISGQQYKCDAILEAMKSAPIPWSKEMNNLVQQGLKLDHDLVYNIREQVHLMELKKLMFKYNLKKEDIPSDNNWEMLMYYILSQNSTDSIEDAFNVMRGYNVTLTHDLYVFRLRHLIKNGMIDECVDLLKSLTGNERVACGQRIIQYIKVLLNDPLEIDAQEIHKKKTLYTEAGCYIIKLIVESVEDFMESNELRSLLQIFQNLLALQKEYKQYITIDQYSDENVRTKLLVSYAKQFFIKRGTNKKEANYTKVFRLADILQISRVKIQGQLAIEAAKTGGIQTALKHCSKLLESNRTEETAETLYNVALSFLRLQADAENTELTAGQLRSLPEVTNRLASEALAICNGHSDLFMKCLELNKATGLALSISQQCEAGEYSLCDRDELPQEKVTPSSEMVSDWMSDSMFKEDALVMNSTIILPLVSQYCISHPIIDGDVEESESMENMKNCVTPVLQYLKDNSHIQLGYQTLHHMLYSVHQTVLKYQMGLHNETVCENAAVDKSDLEVIEKMSAPLMKEFLTGVLMKIFNSTYTDHQLALAYVLSGSKRDGQEAVIRIIKSSGHNYRRLRAISYVGIGAGEIYKDPNIINMCQKLEVNAKWGNRLAKIKINFKDAFQMPFSEKVKLLPQIAQAEGADTELIIDFCKAFQVNTDEGLMQYLDHVFTEHPSSNTSEPDMKRLQLKKAKAAIEGISDKDNLLQQLKSLFFKTDSYDYEKLEFLIDEMQKIYDTQEGEKHAKVLFYLKQYKRRSPPSEFEINYRPHKDKEEMKIMTDSLSPLSNTRIPLHPLLDGANAWKIIGPELRKDTVASWLPVAQSLKMSADQIYIVTIQNMVNSYVSAAKEPAAVKSQWNWQKKDANKDLLSCVKSLLEQVSNCEMAMACSKWMVTQLPSGAEKVMGLEGCILLAKKWYQALPETKATEKEKAMAAVVKFNAMWRRLATEQILFLHGIQKPELHKLAGTPSKLIDALYEHPCIVETTEDADFPDIHTIVEEVASLNEIDLQQTMLTLIQKWLPSTSSKQQDADSTMTFSFDSLKLSNETMSEAEDEDDQNLKRVMYLLRKGDRKTSLVYLLNFAFKDNQTQEMVAITNMCRLRSLHCVLELGEEKLLQDLCHRTFNDIRDLMKTLTYLVELEKLHILHSIETFKEANKDGLIRGIWRNHYHQKSAALLVASMCLDFKVHEKQLWNGVIQQIMSFGLLENLEYILLRLNSVPDVWQIAVYPKAWQTVLVTPLTKVVAPLSEEQLEMCIHSFNLLKRCPVLHELDMSIFVQHFFRLEMDVCALSCLLFSGEEEAIQNIIARENTKLLDKVDKYVLHSMDSFSAQQVKDHVYAYIINNEEFGTILETKYRTELAQYAVKNKNRAGLIKFVMENDRKLDGDKVQQFTSG